MRAPAALPPLARSRARRSSTRSRDRRTVMVSLLSADRRRADLPAADLQPDREPGRARARRSSCRWSAPSTRRRCVAYLERQQVTLVARRRADYEAQDPPRRPRRRADRRRATSPPTSSRASAGTVRLVFDRSRDRARASIDRPRRSSPRYNRLWGDAAADPARRHAGVANPLASRSDDLATPQQSGALRAVPRRATTACSLGDGRHGGRARHDGRRARAAVARAAADDAGAAGGDRRSASGSRCARSTRWS